MTETRIVEEPADDDNGGRSRTSLVGLIIVIVLVVGGVFLVEKLKAMSDMQDCLMSGRTNCAPIEVPQR
jgi:hypothetical protein